MKTMKWMFTSLTVAAAILLVGCGQSKSGPKVDPSPIEKSFASADTDLKASADKVVKLVKEANFPAALDELKTLAANAKLTEEQKAAAQKVLAEVQKAISEVVTKAAGEANKAMDDMKQTLPK